MVLQFAEKNPGMTRVMVGDALVFENERLQQRMNQFFDKIEATLRQGCASVPMRAVRPRPPSTPKCLRRHSRPSWSGVCTGLRARVSSVRRPSTWTPAWP
jgi:hypothetical protein